MSLFKFSWIDSHAVEIIMGALIVLMIAISVYAIHQDSVANESCANKNGVLVTDANDNYLCVKQDNIKL
jgi:hypothetical protein